MSLNRLRQTKPAAQRRVSLLAIGPAMGTAAFDRPPPLGHSVEELPRSRRRGGSTG
jgi:hypothetical protein